MAEENNETVMDVDGVGDSSASSTSNTARDDPLENLADYVVKMEENKNVDRGHFIAAVRILVKREDFLKSSIERQTGLLVGSMVVSDENTPWVTLPQPEWNEFVGHAVDTNASHGTDTTSPRDESKSALARAFDAPYHDPSQQLESLHKYIKDCSQAFSVPGRNWYSPYISICQSSGWGKSRLLRQLSTRASGLYVSFMSETRRGGGYPLRTTKAIDFLRWGNPAWCQFEGRLKYAVQCMRAFPYYLDFEEYGEHVWDVIIENYEKEAASKQIEGEFRASEGGRESM